MLEQIVKVAETNSIELTEDHKQQIQNLAVEAQAMILGLMFSDGGDIDSLIARATTQAKLASKGREKGKKGRLSSGRKKGTNQLKLQNELRDALLKVDPITVLKAHQEKLDRDGKSPKQLANLTALPVYCQVAMLVGQDPETGEVYVRPIGGSTEYRLAYAGLYHGYNQAEMASELNDRGENTTNPSNDSKVEMACGETGETAIPIADVITFIEKANETEETE